MKKIDEISEKESLWVANIHAKFPTLDVLRSKASEKVMLRYAELTSIDVINGNEIEKTQLMAFIGTLETQYTYEASDLTEVLFTLKNSTRTEKDWVSCPSMCFIESSMEYNQVLLSCNSGRIDPIPGETCRSTASDAMTYYFRGCYSGCSQIE